MLEQRDDNPKGTPNSCKKLDETATRCLASAWDLAPWFEWSHTATAIVGLARTHDKDELAGLTALETVPLDVERCPAEFASICSDMLAIKEKEEYSALFEKVRREPEFGGFSMMPTGSISSSYYYLSIPGMAGYSAESVGYFLDEHVVRRLRKMRKRFGAV